MELLEIRNYIHEIRGRQVMLDRDLAKLYGVETKALNQAVRRNIARFPEDFMFKLTKEERDMLEINLRSQFVTSSWGGNRHGALAFTEQGVAMLSSVLRSKAAIEVNIRIMRAFVAVRQMVSSMSGVTEEINALKRKIEQVETATLEAVNDLSEDTRREMDDIYLALAQMAEKFKKKNVTDGKKRIGYK